MSRGSGIGPARAFRRASCELLTPRSRRRSRDVPVLRPDRRARLRALLDSLAADSANGIGAVIGRGHARIRSFPSRDALVVHHRGSERSTRQSTRCRRYARHRTDAGRATRRLDSQCGRVEMSSLAWGIRASIRPRESRQASEYAPPGSSSATAPWALAAGVGSATMDAMRAPTTDTRLRSTAHGSMRGPHATVGPDSLFHRRFDAVVDRHRDWRLFI
jgi:hypothetical protein